LLNAEHEENMINNTCPEAGPRNEFAISELMREFSVTARTLRFYETKGLLHPTRRGNRRVYSRHDRTRLQFVLLGKRAEFSLLEIKGLLDLHELKDDGATQRRVALVKFREQIHILEQQITEKLQAVEELKENCLSIERIQREHGETE
jgi:DNA-binding transcriptional MerR regulator